MSKVLIVGSGFVGSTAAYSILHRGLARELRLYDADRARAEGEAMDLAHGMSFLKNSDVSVGTLDDWGADLVVIAAGRSSRPGETRLDLLRDNADRVRVICSSLKRWKSRPVVLVVSNPVDVLTEIARRELGWEGRVLGSGTTLDTSRLRSLIGAAVGVDPASIHGYVLGEHGDSEFAAWSTIDAGGINVREFPGYGAARADKLLEQVRRAAYEVIQRKRATYYAIGAAVGALAEAILGDQRSIHAVSVPLGGQYGVRGVSLSLPCVLGREGIIRALEPRLEPDEQEKLLASARVLREALASLESPAPSPARPGRSRTRPSRRGPAAGRSAPSRRS